MEWDMTNSPSLERQFGLDPELTMCEHCKHGDDTFYDKPCSECKLIVTNFEPKD